MKIYIKDMRMPKCCGDCKLLYDSFSCMLTGELMDLIDWELYQKKLPNCPLVEIPSHGRLIDADKLCEFYSHPDNSGGDYTAYHFIEHINNCPTIIEADKEKAKLNPCPFCGSEADTAYNTRFNYQAFCTNENCFMNTITMYGMGTEQDAIEAWNKREKND